MKKILNPIKGTPRLFLSLMAVFVALAAPLLTGCGSGGDGGGGGGDDNPILTGRIVDVNAGAAGVAGATVRFAGVSAQTDSDGNFSLEVPRNTPSGSATITAPAGAALYTYAATSTDCANGLIFTVPALSTNDVSIGNVLVYGTAGPPNIPCRI